MVQPLEMVASISESRTRSESVWIVRGITVVWIEQQGLWVVGRIGGLFRGRRRAALRFGDGHGRRETSFAVGLSPAGGQRGRCWRHDSIGGVEGGIDDIARGRTRALDATRKALGGRRSKWGRAWSNPEREKAPTEAASSSDFPSRSPSVHVPQSPTTPRMPRGGTTLERFDAFAI